jgi:trans-2,3-dihydro-3-hydroxyanthranilate isomerase
VKTLRYVLCDVFTERPLEGIPLAVFTDARAIDALTMQALARETSLLATAFISPPERDGQARLRVFTPERELTFAEHPVLGTAFVLAGPLQTDAVRLELPSGTVTVQVTREAARVSFGWLPQPCPRPVALEAAGPVLEALGSPVPSFPLAAYENSSKHLCLALPSVEAVAALAPDFVALGRATDAGVAAFHCDAERCTLRYFSPRSGRNEDAATSAAAGAIALELRRHGLLEPDASVCIEQGQQSVRPATLYVRILGDAAEPRIELGGSARIVARGQFLI